MSIMTLSSRELNQDVGRAKRASLHGSGVIADRGKTARVLLSIDDYRRLTSMPRNIADGLAMQAGGDIHFDPPRLTVAVRAADLS